jgi:hypothetical protein
MYEEVIGEPELAALVSGVEGIHTSIRRRLRQIWPEMPPLILSLIGAGLADLVQDPTSRQFRIELQGAPPGLEHQVMDLHGLKRLLPAELKRLRALVTRYRVPDLTFALLTDPEVLSAAQAWLAGDDVSDDRISSAPRWRH